MIDIICNLCQKLPRRPKETRIYLYNRALHNLDLWTQFYVHTLVRSSANVNISQAIRIDLMVLQRSQSTAHSFFSFQK